MEMCDSKKLVIFISSTFIISTLALPSGALFAPFGHICSWAPDGTVQWTLSTYFFRSFDRRFYITYQKIKIKSAVTSYVHLKVRPDTLLWAQSMEFRYLGMKFINCVIYSRLAGWRCFIQKTSTSFQILWTVEHV